MAETLIAIRHLTKAYRRGGQEIPVLSDISLDIARGDFLALIGPSGSGKSTLLNCIAGIDTADAGSITVDGTDIATLSEGKLAAWRSRHVGFVFQFYNLIPVLTALENVELPLLLTNLSGRRRKAHALAALTAVGLAERLDHKPSELSGGQQQRVAIARAIVTDPTIIVADEPTGDLDRHSADDVLRLLDRLNTELGKTIVMPFFDALSFLASSSVTPRWHETWPFGPGLTEGFFSVVLKGLFILMILGGMAWLLRFLYGPGGVLRDKEFDEPDPELDEKKHDTAERKP